MDGTLATPGIFRYPFFGVLAFLLVSALAFTVALGVWRLGFRCLGAWVLGILDSWDEINEVTNHDGWVAGWEGEWVGGYMMWIMDGEREKKKYQVLYSYR